MKNWRRSARVSHAPAWVGCGYQVETVTLTANGILAVDWLPADPGFTLTIDRQVNGGGWTEIAAGVDSDDGHWEGGEVGLNDEDEVVVRIRRDGTAVECGVLSNTAMFSP